MKSLLTFFALAITTTSFSQSLMKPFRLGFKAGVNINKIDGKAYKEGFNFNYLLGVFGQIRLGSRFGLQPEINLTQGEAEFSNDPTEIYDDLFRSGTQTKAKLTHLQVPVLVNINIGPTDRVKLQLGPQYGNIINETTDSLKTNGNLFKNAEWSAVGGVWIQLPVVNFGARYVMGLTDINAVDDRQSWKNKGFNLFLGVTL
jgi:opacity protein-like surface antigen